MRKAIALVYREIWLLRNMWDGWQGLTFYDDKGKIFAIAAVREVNKDIRFKSFWKRRDR